MMKHNPVVTREEWSNAHRVRDQIVKTFPACFAGKGKSKCPLKIGIDVDILKAVNLDPREVSLAIHDYTNGPTYLKNVVEGAERIGLDGQVCGVVTAEQAKQAAGRLAKRNARDAARNAKQEHATAAAATAAILAIVFLSADRAHAACVQGPAVAEAVVPALIVFGIVLGVALSGVMLAVFGRRS